MEEQYVDKISTLALLALGGLSEEELLELPEVSKEDIEAAYQLLKKKGCARNLSESKRVIAWQVSKRLWQ